MRCSVCGKPTNGLEACDTCYAALDRWIEESEADWSTVAAVDDGMHIVGWLWIVGLLAVLSALVWIAATFWNGLFWIVAAMAVVAVVWPELPGRVASWIGR